MTSPTYTFNKSEIYYRKFKQSIKSKETFVTYDHRLKAYMKYRHLTEFSQLIDGSCAGEGEKDVKEIEDEITDFIIFLKERNYSLASQKGYLDALNHFYDVNDITIRRKKISKFLSNDDIIITTNDIDTNDNNTNDYSGNGDKPYTHEQIAKLLNFADVRTKVMILLMCSSGMRIGALPTLKVGDLIEIPRYNVYQIRVYAYSKTSRYHTFCTPECKSAIDSYINYRRSCGENITPKSPLFRREFDKHDVWQVAKEVKPLTKASVKKAIGEILYSSGLRTPLATAPEIKDKRRLNTRRETALSHGFRKFFDTTCTHSGMNPVYVEWCLGHKLKGVKDSYFLPQPDSNGVYKDILEGNNNGKSLGYIDAIDYLTIDNSRRLERENEMLKVKKSEFEFLKEQVEETKRAQAKFANDLMLDLKRKLGIAPDVNKIELEFKPGIVDLDAEIMAEMNSKSKKEQNNNN
jgi:integrase